MPQHRRHEARQLMMHDPHNNVLSEEHLRALYTFSLDLNSRLDFDDVLNRFLETVMHLTNAQRGFVMMAPHEGGTLEVIVARGLDGRTLGEEGYSTTVVSRVVETGVPLLTNNAQYDDRYQAGQSIIIRGLRAILCAPMMVRERLIGVVYVDTSMRSGAFTEADLGLLSAAAGMAGVASENARLFRVAVEKGRIERELQMAQEMQRALLPAQLPVLLGYSLAARWLAAREMAGDFYDAFVLPDGQLGVVIADVSDKGAGAAMFMAVARTMLRSFAFNSDSAQTTLGRTNDLLLHDSQNGMFVTVFHSWFAADGSSVHVCGGHNPPLYYHAATRRLHRLPHGGRALGWFPDNPLRTVTLQMEPGDVILYYTDGLTEAEVDGVFFGEERLALLLEAYAHLPLEDLCDRVIEAVAVFTGGAPLADDLTLLVVRHDGPFE